MKTVEQRLNDLESSRYVTSGGIGCYASYKFEKAIAKSASPYIKFAKAGNMLFLGTSVCLVGFGILIRM